MKQNRVKKQHHVPQMYLRAWADSKNGLFVLLKEHKKVIGAKIGDIGCESGFYDAPVKSEFEPQFVEHSLADVEALLAPFLKELAELTIESNPILFDSSRRDAISLFMALQILRSLETRKLFEEGLQFLVDQGLKIATTPLADSVTLNVEPGAIKHDHVEFISSYLMEFSSILRRKILLVGFRVNGDSFWTSDNPVMMLDSGFGVGLESPGAAFLLPVSPKAVVIATDEVGIKHLNILGSTGAAFFSAKQIERLNDMQVLSASRQVMSNQNKFKRVLKKLNSGYFTKPSRSSLIHESAFYAEWEELFRKASLELPFGSFMTELRE